jgi:hypothetical protein
MITHICRQPKEYEVPNRYPIYLDRQRKSHVNDIATNISLVVLPKNLEIVFYGGTMESGEAMYHLPFHKLQLKLPIIKTDYK